MRALPRMEAHVFDAGHMLLETHAAAAASLMLDFIRRTATGERKNDDAAKPQAPAADGIEKMENSMSMHPYAIIEAPSTLGLATDGVEGLTDRLLELRPC